MPPRTSQTGTARTRASGRTAATLLAKPDLAQRRRELARVLEPDLRGGLRHVAVDGVADGLAARGLLERGDVCLGDALDVVLGPRPHRFRRSRERRGDGFHLALA